MKKIIKISLIILSFVLVLSSCTQNTQKPEPTPVPEKKTYSYDDVIEVNSPIVGQWVPSNSTEQINGYMQFTSDGNLVQFILGSNGEMNYNELRYYLTSDNTFKMIREDNSVSIDIKFEVKDDGETLNVYNNPSSSAASSFKRIDN